MPAPWGYQDILYSKVCSGIVFGCYPDLFLNTNNFNYYYFKNIQNLILHKSVMSNGAWGIY